MNPDHGLYPRPRATAKTWAALIAAAAAVLVLTVLIAVACRSERAQAPVTAGSSEVVDADGAAGSEGQADPGPDTGDEPAGGEQQPGGTDGEASGDDPGEPGDDGGPLPGVQVVRERHTVPALGYLRQGVRCPEGLVVLNGGFASLIPDQAEHRLTLQESAPGTLGGGAVSLWLVSIRSEAGEAVTVDLYAVCADPLPGYEVIRQDAPLGPSAVVEGAPVCPDGRVTVGGGAQVVGAGSADFRTTIVLSAPLNHPISTFSWRTAIANSTTIGRTVGFTSVCVDALPGFQLTFTDAAAAPGSVATAAVVCPAGTVIGGGVGPREHEDGPQRIHQTYPEAGPGSWVATSRNPAPAPRTFRFWAVCAHTG